jgi:hypothetical protein
VALAIRIGEGVMQEEARRQNKVELLERVANDIAAFHNGGPNLRAEHLQLVDELGLSEAWIDAEWDKAEQRKSPPLQPDAVAAGLAEASKVGAKVEAADWRWEMRKPPEEAKPAAEINQEPNPVSAPSISGEANVQAAVQPEPELAEPEPEPEQEAEPQAAALPIVVPSPPVIEDIWGRALAEMNRSHAVIASVGGKTVIASWEPSEGFQH